MAKKRRKLNFFQRLILTYRIRLKRLLQSKPKYRLSKKAKIIVISVFSFIILIYSLKFGYSTYRISTQTKLGYSKDQAIYLLDNNLTKITKEYGYSNYFITSHMKNSFDTNYTELYFYLNDVNETTKLYYTKLTNKGYSKDEIKTILTSLKGDEQIIPLLIYEKQDNLNQYINDALKNKLTKSYLNPYVNVSTINDLQIDTLINKKNGVDSSFTPPNLKNLSTYCAFNPGQLVEEAALAFYNMCMDAKSEGIYFASMVAYRSYAEQESIYNQYLNNYGSLQVDSYTPKPGFSEHQSGLALNVASMAKYPEGTPFIETYEYEWLVKNAASYGFIFRYPAGKEHITGFSSEPSHLRYVGTSLAEVLVSNNLTLEEYYVLYK